jgi:hypothetical protein
VRRGDDLTTFMFRVSKNLGALTSRPRRPVTGMFYLYFLWGRKKVRRSVAHRLNGIINLVVSSKDEEFLGLLKDCPLLSNDSDVRNETT